MCKVTKSFVQICQTVLNMDNIHFILCLLSLIVCNCVQQMSELRAWRNDTAVGAHVHKLTSPLLTLPCLTYYWHCTLHKLSSHIFTLSCLHISGIALCKNLTPRYQPHGNVLHIIGIAHAQAYLTHIYPLLPSQGSTKKWYFYRTRVRSLGMLVTNSLTD